MGEGVRVASLLRADDPTLAAALAGDDELTGLAQLHGRFAQIAHHGPAGSEHT